MLVTFLAAPGAAFAVTTDYTHSMRLCFTTSDTAALTEAVTRLSRAVDTVPAR